MAEQWLSIVEFARRYKISDMTIRRRIKTGKLQAVLQEGKYYIPMSEIEKAQQDHQQGGGRTDFMIDPRRDPRRDPSLDPRSEIEQAPMTLVKAHPQPGMSIQTDQQSQQPMIGYQGNFQSSHQNHHQNQHQIQAAYLQSQPQRVQAPQLPRNSYPPLQGRTSDTPQGAPSSYHPAPHNVQTRDSTIIPENLWRPLAEATHATVDTKALLAYCEATVRKAMELERKAIDRFKSKLEALEATLSAKDLEIKSLRQQIEDMQLLVKIIERRK
jgi:hypothetical protein